MLLRLTPGWPFTAAVLSTKLLLDIWADIGTSTSSFGLFIDVLYFFSNYIVLPLREVFTYSFTTEDEIMYDAGICCIWCIFFCITEKVYQGMKRTSKKDNDYNDNLKKV